MSISPSFFIVGAAKSGTSILARWLNEHPDVFMPAVNEPNFFALKDQRQYFRGDELDLNYRNSFTLTREEYLDLYADASERQIAGDASPSYLYFSGSAKAIRSFNPSAKVIAIFRHPVDRAFSQFRHHRRDGYEPYASFGQALKAEHKRINDGWWWGFHYRQAGLYAKQWSRFLKVFPEHQLLALDYNELVADPEIVWARVCDFLWIPHSIDIDLSTGANGGAPLRAASQTAGAEALTPPLTDFRERVKNALPAGMRVAMTGALRALNQRSAPQLSDEIRGDLVAYYADDIRALSAQTKLDLRNWLDPNACAY